MARTKKQDPRSVKDFGDLTRLSTTLHTARQKYALACEPPPGFVHGAESGSDPDDSGAWNGRKFDGLFGLPNLREFANTMWTAQDTLAAEMRRQDPEAAPLKSGRIEPPRVPAKRHIFRIPRIANESPILISTTTRTYYPGEGTDDLGGAGYVGVFFYGRVPTLRHADYRVLTPAQRAEVESLRVWGKEVLASRVLASAAIEFLSAVFRCADQMRDVLELLPGLDELLLALLGSGHAGSLREAREHKRGSTPFNRALLRSHYPNWPTLWAGHRATLLALTIANDQDWRVQAGTGVAYHHDSPTYPVDE